MNIECYNCENKPSSHVFFFNTIEDAGRGETISRNTYSTHTTVVYEKIYKNPKTYVVGLCEDCLLREQKILKEKLKNDKDKWKKEANKKFLEIFMEFDEQSKIIITGILTTIIPWLLILKTSNLVFAIILLIVSIIGIVILLFGIKTITCNSETCKNIISGLDELNKKVESLDYIFSFMLFFDSYLFPQNDSNFKFYIVQSGGFPVAQFLSMINRHVLTPVNLKKNSEIGIKIDHPFIDCHNNDFMKSDYFGKKIINNFYGTLEPQTLDSLFRNMSNLSMRDNFETNIIDDHFVFIGGYYDFGKKYDEYNNKIVYSLIKYRPRLGFYKGENKGVEYL